MFLSLLENWRLISSLSISLISIIMEKIVTRKVWLLGRRQGSNENICSMECDIYDMSAYMLYLRMCQEKTIDYFVVEPVVITPLGLF